MTALRASKAPATLASSGIAPAHPKLADASSPGASGMKRAATFSPFASLKQEQTVEAKVSTQLLTLTKGSLPKGGLAMGGATQAYQVPEELMALAGRKKAALESAAPPARASAAGLGLAPSLPAAAAMPSIAAPAPESSFNWLAVSVIAYALLCAAYWLAPHWG